MAGKNQYANSAGLGGWVVDQLRVDGAVLFEGWFTAAVD